MSSRDELGPEMEATFEKARDYMRNPSTDVAVLVTKQRVPDNDELPRYAHAQQRFSFIVDDMGPRVVAVPDKVGNWVRQGFIGEVIESIAHAQDLIERGQIAEAKEKIDHAYDRLRTPTDY